MEHHNLLESLAYHAKTQPTKHAIYLLNFNDIHTIDQQITYQDLYIAVNQLAHNLKETIEPGQRVLLCYPTGLDFVIAFYACLMAKAIAVAVTVPSNIGLMHKLEAINKDCTPSLILTDSKTNVLFHESNLTTPLVVFEATLKLEETTIPTALPNIAPHDIAFLQYTSGSTTSPKGVMISHANLMDNIPKMSLAFDGTKDSIGLKWIPHTHDMGLIGSFLHSVHKGAEIYLM